MWTMGHNDSAGGGGGGSKPLPASGQLGRGGAGAGREPGRVEGALAGKVVTQAVAGRYHTLAVTSDGGLYSWGLNDYGQLGRGAGADADRRAPLFPAPSSAAAPARRRPARRRGGQRQHCRLLFHCG